MSINSYLSNLASKLVLSSDEKDNIKVSIDTLKQRLNNYFGNEIKGQFIFGSYERETILPRKVDESSDVDYMIIFDNSGDYKPQTFLNKLKNFSETKYSTSEIHQSSPTMVLELNHIKFELVPAYRGLLAGTYYISDGNGGWITTYPFDFNSKLLETNKNNNFKIKPIIRLIKGWNVQKNKHALTSYEIEEIIAYNMNFSYISCSSYTDYVKEAFKKIRNTLFNYAIKERIDLAIKRIDEAIEYEVNGYPCSALDHIKKVFPEV